ncbi:hypothetical protein GGI23_005885, partial [Coemansia sp. RSA 2559]
MYPLFRDFVMLVAHKIKACTECYNCESGTEVSPYLILSSDGSDNKPLDDDDSTKIDGALALSKQLTEIEELKQLKNEQCNVYVQLIKYTRNIYTMQDHRHFVWGLMMCGTVVRCYLFHHDGIRATSDIDISDMDSLKRLVTLFVHWSFCSTDHLGYDMSMM